MKREVCSRVWLKGYSSRLVLWWTVFIIFGRTIATVLASGVVTNCTETDLAAAMQGGGLVTFACDGTIVLNSPLLITNNTTLDGTGHSVCLSGINVYSAFIVYTNGSLVLKGVTVMNAGRPDFGAGGAINNSGVVSAWNCIFATNQAPRGGAIAESLSSAVTILNNCLFIGNVASQGGALGGSLFNTGTRFITNCTFFGNSATRGSAVFLQSSRTNYLVNCTIVSNGPTAVSYGGPSGTRLHLKNSIVAHNLGTNCEAVTDDGHNLISDNSLIILTASTVVGDPMLGPLTMNGGMTATMMPSAGSLVIDAASDDAPTQDQRGVSRPIGPHPDIGSVEVALSGSTGSFHFGQQIFTVTESAGTATISVMREGGTSGAVTVDFAASSADGRYMTNGTIAFADGVSEAAFALRVINDAVATANEDVNLHLSNPTGGASITLPDASLIITDDDGFVFSFGAANYQGEERSGMVLLTVLRSGNTGLPASVNFATASGTAVAGQDFVGTNGTLTFLPGETTKTFAFQVLNDSSVEPDETATMTLLGGTGGLVTNGTATVTIVDDDILLTSCTEIGLRDALAVADSIIWGCDGAIVLSNTLGLTRSVTLDGNGREAILSGGGVRGIADVRNGAEFTMKRMTLQEGRALNGGAIFNGGITRLIDCTFKNNVAQGEWASGGALYQSYSGRLEVSGCTFVGNSVSAAPGTLGEGGAIGGNNATPIAVTNSTFLGNSAARGGAIGQQNARDAAFVVNSTFLFNTNGAIDYSPTLQAPGGSLTVFNSVFGNNNGFNCVNVIDGGYNVSSDGSGGFRHPFSVENLNPQLGTLASNGGPTLTVAPLASSPTINGAGPGLPSIDQRGVPRPVGAYGDIGAVESSLTGTHPGVFQLALTTNLFKEGNAIVRVGVARAGGSAGTATVAFAVTGVTATPGEDFIATNGILSFVDGQRTNFFEFVLLTDGVTEPTERLRVNLSNPTGGATLGRASADLDILDSDVTLGFFAGAVTIDERVGFAPFTVIRRGDTSVVASATFQIVPGTAGWTDVGQTNRVVTLAAGELTKTIYLSINNDIVPEVDETFTLVLRPDVGLGLATPGSVVVTINDDDGERVVTNCDEASLRAAVARGGSVRLGCDGTIVLTNTLELTPDLSLDASGHRVTLSGGRARPVIYVPTNIRATLRQLTIADGLKDSFTSAAAGIINYGTLDVAQCTLASNVTSVGFIEGYPGGAIFNGGTLRVWDSTFVGNRSLDAAAIATGYRNTPLQQFSGPIFVTNCTFYNNVNDGGATITARAAANGSNYIVSCTFVGDGQAVLGSLVLQSSILSGSRSGNCSGIIDGGYNLSSDNSCGFTQPSSRNDVNPRLGVLANNGGPTLTVALLDGSPARDAGDPVNYPLTDQRGYVRPYGIAPDIGAFEATLVGNNAGAFQWTAATTRVSEGSGQVVVSVRRAGGTFGPASVQFSTASLGATPGVDYVQTNGTLTFATGESQKSFGIRLLDDGLVEPDEAFQITLSAPTGAVLGSPTMQTVTIADDETTISICDEAGLRAAIATGASVRFACDAVIRLTESLRIIARTRLDANGHAVTLTGSNAVRLFVIEPGATLQLQGLHVADGRAEGTTGPSGTPGGTGEGGAILNLGGTLSGSDCVFVNNAAIGGNGNGPSQTGGLGRGGAIFNFHGSVLLTNCLFLQNRSEGGTDFSSIGAAGVGEAYGGAIANEQGSLLLFRTKFVENSTRTYHAGFSAGSFVGSPAFGGAIYNLGDADLIDCQLSRNQSIADYFHRSGGGALFHSQGFLRMTRTFVDGNYARSGSLFFGFSEPATGGGVCVDGGIAILETTTLTGNTAVGGAGFARFPGQGAHGGPGKGGGLYCAGLVAMTNCTFNANVAQGGSATGVGPYVFSGDAEGGGIYNSVAGFLSLTHVTMAGDAARLAVIPNGSIDPASVVQRGGEIASLGGQVTLRNSLLAQSSPSGSNWFGAELIDDGNNLSSDLSCPLTAPGSLVGVDPRISPLLDFDGATPTIALLAGSPAIDAAASVYCASTDQRGRPRPFGVACDIGAFESSAPFSIKGAITGFLPTPSSIVMTSPLGTTVPNGAGAYTLDGFSAGQFLIRPTSPEIVFVPSNRLVSVSADWVGADFHSYRTNALVIEKIPGPAVRVVYAGQAGTTYQVWTSTNLINWTVTTTGPAASSGLLEFSVPLSPSDPRRFYQAIRP